MKSKYLFILLLLIKNPVFSASHSARLSDTIFKVASALQSNMVIQQQKPLKIWGTATHGQKISLSPDWIKTPVMVTADESDRFLGIVPVPTIAPGDFSKHTIKISNGTDELSLTNILIGDVWLCSGQSNMQFSMKGSLDSATDIASANYPNIRLLNVGLNFSNDPIDDFKGGWQECSPLTVRNFSAVGYYFGREIYQKLNIPIGLIFSGIGASAAQAFVPRDVLASNVLLDTSYLQPYLNNPKSKEKMTAGFSFEKVTRPFLLYNALIHPLTSTSIKGICWYQGESNRTERDGYTNLMYAMIESWRKNFGQGSLPFYYVQIAPYFYDKEDPSLADCAFFREAQENISQLNNTSMVLTMDVGEAKDLHPKNKKPVGIRLAKTALNRTYGMLDVVYRGPQFAFAEFNKREVTVHFQDATVTSGLETNNGKEPEFFFLAGQDKKFYPATAQIKDKMIVLHSTAVKQPVAVRYAFTNYAVTNLQNKDGFPVVPFRTDHWNEKRMMGGIELFEKTIWLV